MLKTYLLSALFLFACVATSQAQVSELPTLEVNNVLSAAQCELGLFARHTKYVPSTPSRGLARIVVEGKEIKTQTYRAGLPIFGGSFNQVVTHRWKVTAPRNIHKENTKACAHYRPAVDIESCLMKQTSELKSTTDDAECETTISATRTLSIGGKLVWLITADLSAEDEVQRQFTVTVITPPPSGH